MVNTIKNKIKELYRKINLSKINYFNHKFKKYIIKYEEKKDKLKIYNSNGDFKIVNNTIPNKVKIMEIIKEHQKEIDYRINYYDNNKDDYKIIILLSSFFLCVLGCVFIFSFFVGSYLFLLLSLISFSITFTLFIINTYKNFMFREEIKRLKLIKENKNILNDDELKDIILDLFKIIKNYFYSVIIKILDMFETKKVKS